MGNQVYSLKSIEEADLEEFSAVALQVLQSTAYGREFREALELIALCQGGGLHYAVTHRAARSYLHPPRQGLKDIDLWCFFRRPGFHPMWQHHVDFGPSKFGRNPEDRDYVGRRVDVFGRSISSRPGEDIEAAVQRWLQNGKTGSSPWHLARKAVVAIYPERLRGNILWVNPELQ